MAGRSISWRAFPSFISERLANNGVRDNAGVFPLVYDTVTNGSFVRVRAEFLMSQMG